jgi:hypothetical protein
MTDAIYISGTRELLVQTVVITKKKRRQIMIVGLFETIAQQFRLLLFYDVKFLLLRNCVDRSGH